MTATTNSTYAPVKQTAFVPWANLLHFRSSSPILHRTTFTNAVSHPLNAQKRSRTLRMTAANPLPDDDEERALPEDVMQREWREFRAALVAGSVEELERSKQTAHRPGHWAHPVRANYSIFLRFP